MIENYDDFDFELLVTTVQEQTEIIERLLGVVEKLSLLTQGLNIIGSNKPNGMPWFNEELDPSDQMLLGDIIPFKKRD